MINIRLLSDLAVVAKDIQHYNYFLFFAALNKLMNLLNKCFFFKFKFFTVNFKLLLNQFSYSCIILVLIETGSKYMVIYSDQFAFPLSFSKYVNKAGFHINIRLHLTRSCAYETWLDQYAQFFNLIKLFKFNFFDQFQISIVLKLILPFINDIAVYL